MTIWVVVTIWVFVTIRGVTIWRLYSLVGLYFCYKKCVNLILLWNAVPNETGRSRRFLVSWTIYLVLLLFVCQIWVFQINIEKLFSNLYIRLLVWHSKSACICRYKVCLAASEQLFQRGIFPILSKIHFINFYFIYYDTYINKNIKPVIPSASQTSFRRFFLFLNRVSTSVASSREKIGLTVFFGEKDIEIFAS